MTIKRVLLGLGLLMVVSCLYPTDCGIARDKARTASCQANLKSLGLRFIMYANDTGEFPDNATMKALLGNNQVSFVEKLNRRSPYGHLFKLVGYIQNTNMLFCPADPVVLSKWKKETTFSYAWNDKLSELPSVAILNAKEVPALFCRQPWHVDGRNVVFADGHVKWLREENWRKAMQVKPALSLSNRQPSTIGSRLR